MSTLRFWESWDFLVDSPPILVVLVLDSEEASVIRLALSDSIFFIEAAALVTRVEMDFWVAVILVTRDVTWVWSVASFFCRIAGSCGMELD